MPTLPIDPREDAPVTIYTWRYLPSALVFRVSPPAGRLFAMEPRPVQGVTVYAPNEHPAESPLRPSCWTVAVAGLGAIRRRWYGFEVEPVITSELRLAVLAPLAFEELRAWPAVPAAITTTELALDTTLEA